jgi:hypothetical protein
MQLIWMKPPTIAIEEIHVRQMKLGAIKTKVMYLVAF